MNNRGNNNLWNRWIIPLWEERRLHFRNTLRLQVSLLKENSLHKKHPGWTSLSDYHQTRKDFAATRHKGSAVEPTPSSLSLPPCHGICFVNASTKIRIPCGWRDTLGWNMDDLWIDGSIQDSFVSRNVDHHKRGTYRWFIPLAWLRSFEDWIELDDRFRNFSEIKVIITLDIGYWNISKDLSGE